MASFQLAAVLAGAQSSAAARRDSGEISGLSGWRVID